MPRLSSERAIRGKNLVGFRVGDVAYAVEIQRVREIIRPLSLLPLPHLPPSVVGVVDHRGDVVPVVDLRVRFGLQPESKTREERWIIVKRGDRFVGLVVDKVTDVFGAGESQHRDVPEIGIGDDHRGIASVYASRGELVFVLDVGVVTAPAEEVDVSALQALANDRGEG